MKRLISLLIVAGLAWAGFHTIPVYLRYFQFDEAVKELARFAGTRSEAEIRQEVLDLADRYEVPLDPEDLIVRRTRGATEISAPYVERVEVLPRYYYDWEFDAGTPYMTDPLQ